MVKKPAAFDGNSKQPFRDRDGLIFLASRSVTDDQNPPERDDEGGSGVAAPRNRGPKTPSSLVARARLPRTNDGH